MESTEVSTPIDSPFTTEALRYRMFHRLENLAYGKIGQIVLMFAIILIILTQISFTLDPVLYLVLGIILFPLFIIPVLAFIQIIEAIQALVMIKRAKHHRQSLTSLLDITLLLFQRKFLGFAQIRLRYDLTKPEDQNIILFKLKRKITQDLWFQIIIIGIWIRSNIQTITTHSISEIAFIVILLALDIFVILNSNKIVQGFQKLLDWNRDLAMIPLQPNVEMQSLLEQDFASMTDNSSDWSDPTFENQDEREDQF